VARGGAQERYGVTPDLTVLGKIIGGGLPVGAYGGRADLMGLVAPDGPVYQAGTLSGNPLAMAAGVATLGALDAELYARLERAGERLETGLAAAAQAAGASVRIGRVASLLTLFLADGTFPAFFHAMLSAGFLLPPSQHEAWFISAAHRVDDLDATIDAAGVAFERMNEDR
jgi:glutamate-1-semialdehyde 2,1-aminomutase